MWTPTSSEPFEFTRAQRRYLMEKLSEIQREQQKQFNDNESSVQGATGPDGKEEQGVFHGREDGRDP